MRWMEENPDGVTQADIIVGIPSYNEAESIAFPTRQSDRGLSKYFGKRSAVIINCDNNSPDGTRAVFMATPTEHAKLYISTPEGVKGKGNNFKNLFIKAMELSAKAVIVVDADLKSIEPQWIRNLGEPLFDDYHYVTPLYIRHKYDGTMTSNIAYPLTRALYGRRVRQPIGGDFGFSGELARVYLETGDWPEAVSEFGIDVWMTTLAMRSNMPVIQSFMGKPKINRPKDAVVDPGPVFTHVTSTIFDLMIRFQEFWKEVKWSRPTAVFGFGVGEIALPPTVDVDTEKLRAKFGDGIQHYLDLYRECLHPATFDKLQEVAGLSEDAFEFPTELWAKVLYDFACAYRADVARRQELINSLVPLYNGKTLSFVNETAPMNTQQVEEVIEDLCLQFEKTKPYLLERWFAG